MSKQREALEKALEKALDALNAAQDFGYNSRRQLIINLISEALTEPEQKPLRRGDRLKCMESGEYCIVWATSRSGKTMIQWADRRFGEYTEEQIGEHFWIVPEIEQEPVAWLSQGGDVSRSKKHFDEMGFVDSIPLYTSPPARKPLTDAEIDAEFTRECYVSVTFADGTQGIALDKVTARDFARAIERAHGIGDE